MTEPVRQQATLCIPKEKSKISSHLSQCDPLSAAELHGGSDVGPLAYGGSKSLVFHYTQCFAEEATTGK